MKIPSYFAAPVVLISILLAQGSPPRSARVGPAEIYPDPTMTPGAANPDITQGNIQSTICSREWSTRMSVHRLGIRAS